MTSTAKTDANGTVVSAGATPAQVSALLGHGNTRNILTWTSVKGGDELFARDIEPYEDDAVPGFTVTLPGRIDNATHYAAQVDDCDGNDTPPEPINVLLWDGCASAKNAVLARAQNGDGKTLAFAFKKDLPLPADAARDQVTTGDWVIATNVSLSVTGVPSTDSFVPTVNGVLSQIVGGVSVRPGRCRSPLRRSTSSLRTASRTRSRARRPFTSEVGRGSRSSSNSPRPRARSSSISARRFRASPGPPSTRQTLLARESRGNRPRRSRQPMAATWSRRTTTIASAQWRGRFIVSPDATEVRAPTLPTDAAEWAPQVGGGDAGKPSKFEFPEILFAESDIFPDYAAFRREAGRLGSSYDSRTRRAERVVLPKVGTFRATAYTAAD